MDYGLFAASYCSMHATHGVADYWFQTKFQAENKTSRIDALTRHIIVYTLSFIPALVFLGVSSPWKLILCLLVIGLPHMWMDTRQFLNWFIATTKGWTKEKYLSADPVLASTITHVSIEMDQKFHYLCLALASALVATL